MPVSTIFCRQDAAAERRFEDGGNTGTHTGGDGDASVFHGKTRDLGNKRAETGAHPVKPGLPDRRCRPVPIVIVEATNFHVGDAPADISVLIVVRVDGGIGAVAFSLRRQFITTKTGQ